MIVGVADIGLSDLLTAYIYISNWAFCGRHVGMKGTHRDFDFKNGDIAETCVKHVL